MIVTCTTVGYGDISPQTDWGRFAAMAMISFAIITVPQMTNELIEKMGQLSIYARARYIPKTPKSQHVLICGDCGNNSSSLLEFFAELFHEDHDVGNLHAVVLQPGYPSIEMRHIIIKDPIYSKCVTYLDGSPLNDHDLTRALTSSARAVFILANKFTTNPDEEDAKTILQQFSIQRHFNLHGGNSRNSNTSGNTNNGVGGSIAHYTGRYSTVNVMRKMIHWSYSCIYSLFSGHGIQIHSDDDHIASFCIQLIRPDNKRHLASTAAHHSDTSINHPQHIVCLNEIKMGVIAKACIFPVSYVLICML